MTTIPASILEEAHHLVTGPRNDLYGPFVDDYTQTVDLFAAMTGHELTPAEGCLFMAAMKLSRINTGLRNGVTPARLRDSFVDAAGYLEGAWQCVTDACSGIPEH